MKNNKKKLLLVSAISPFPKDSGGAVRIYNTIKNLSKQFDLYLFCFKSVDYQLSESDINFFQNNSKYFYFFNLKNNKQELDFIKYFQPYWFSDWYNQELQIALHNFVIDKEIDIVQIEFTQLAYLYDYIPNNVKKIFTAHDISTVSFKRRLQEVKNFKTKFVHFFRWIEVYLYERFYLSKYDLVCPVSKNDENTLNKMFKPKYLYTVPNGLEAINFIKKNNSHSKNVINLGYIGSFSHTPNKYAFIYFLNHIAPLLEQKGVKYKFFIAGKNREEEINDLIEKSKIKIKSNIINLGFLPTTKDFFKKIDILVTPIFSGSGSRIKIFESLSYGVPVISTKVGAEGINIKSDYLSICESDEQFTEKIIKIHKIFNKIIHEQDNLKKQIESQLWKNIFNKFSKKILHNEI